MLNLGLVNHFAWGCLEDDDEDGTNNVLNN